MQEASKILIFQFTKWKLFKAQQKSFKSSSKKLFQIKIMNQWLPAISLIDKQETFCESSSAAPEACFCFLAAEKKEKFQTLKYKTQNKAKRTEKQKVHSSFKRNFQVFPQSCSSNGS